MLFIIQHINMLNELFQNYTLYIIRMNSFHLNHCFMDENRKSWQDYKQAVDGPAFVFLMVTKTFLFYHFSPLL